MRIHHLNCGTMCPLARRLINGDGKLFERGKMVCHVLLVEGRDGLTLVDTGYGLADLRAPAKRLGRAFLALTAPALREEETALRQVEKLGFSAKDVVAFSAHDPVELDALATAAKSAPAAA